LHTCSPHKEAGEPKKMLVDLLTHIGSKEEYSNVWKEAVRLNGHSLVPRLDVTATFDEQLACNMNQTHMKSLCHCLHAEMGH
jgi:hypothetical protein